LRVVDKKGRGYFTMKVTESATRFSLSMSESTCLPRSGFQSREAYVPIAFSSRRHSWVSPANRPTKETRCKSAGMSGSRVMIVAGCG